jgi:hypothetical protein
MAIANETLSAAAPHNSRSSRGSVPGFHRLLAQTRRWRTASCGGDTHRQLTGFAIQYGVFRPMTPRCARAWRRCGLRDPATGSPPLAGTRGAALLSRGTAAERGRGLELMVQVREVVRPRGRFLVPVVDLWVAR